MMVLGITGGIASGKSFVSRLIAREWHIPVYDTDASAKRLNNESSLIRRALTDLVGDEVYDVNGLLNRQVLANYLFSSEEHAARVNAIVHPAVREDFRQWLTRQTASVVAMESAILFESGFHSEVDRVLYVDASVEVRVRRAMERDNASEVKVRQRIALQNAERSAYSVDYVLWNEGKDEAALLASLKPFIESLFDK